MRTTSRFLLIALSWLPACGSTPAIGPDEQSPPATEGGSSFHDGGHGDSFDGGGPLLVEGECSTLPDPAWILPCETMIDNQRRFVIPALERLSGVSLRSCFDRIRITFRDNQPNDNGLAWTTVDGPGAGRNEYTFSLVKDLLLPDSGPSWPFDVHEPLHLLYRCVGVPALEDANHSFWFGVERELALLVQQAGGFDAAGKLAAADLEGAQYWVAKVEAQPDAPDIPLMLAGCHGAKTLALTADYLKIGQPLVTAFFASLASAYTPQQVTRDTRGMPTDKYDDLVVGLVMPGTPERQRIDRYCYPNDAGDAAAE